MTSAVLLLNADYTPIKVIPWERAICMILDDKVNLVTEYAGRFIHSAKETIAWPAVIALKKFRQTSSKVRFSRSNLLVRDDYECMYCGVKPRTASGNPRLDDLTLDHIVPRAQAKNGMVTLPWNKKVVAVTCWENVVSACCECNFRKADRTPAEAKMTLRRLPFKPSPWDAIRMSFAKYKIPEEWQTFLPADSPWKQYWTSELDPS